MLDTFTLRVAFGLVALCVLVLFYGATYRSSRSAYSAWWCLSLGCFLVSALLFLLNGSALQVAANPLGNTVGVLGAGCVWAGARSLRGRSVDGWQLGLPPLVALAASLVDDPAGDVWSGGAVYLVAMGLQIGRSSLELCWLLRDRERGVDRAQVDFAVGAMALASGGIGAYYLARAGVFVAVGPGHPAFAIGFGPQTTTLLTMLLLVVVTFSMSTLSHEQQTSELRVRATRDGLTGLLNRSEFLRAAQRELDDGRLDDEAAVVIADLDRFKTLNDGHGHAAGDHALSAFAEACEAVVGARGLVGRLGGDEFVLFTRGRPAEEVVAAISGRYREDPAPMPTASYGIATARPGAEIGVLMGRADEALYEAKAGGRARASRHGAREPRGEDRRSA